MVAEGDFPSIVDKTDLEPVELRQQTEPDDELDHELRDLGGMIAFSLQYKLYLADST